MRGYRHWGAVAMQSMFIVGIKRCVNADDVGDAAQKQEAKCRTPNDVYELNSKKEGIAASSVELQKQRRQSAHLQRRQQCGSKAQMREQTSLLILSSRPKICWWSHGCI